MIKVFLNGSEIEVLDVESLGLGITYSVVDHNDLGARKNATTKTLKVPLTKENKIVMGFTEDFNVSDGMNQTQTITGRVEDDGEVLIDGYFKITGAVWSFQYEGVYEGVIIGDNGDWRVLNYNKYLTELDFSADNHTWNRNNETNSWVLNGNYIYPLTNYGKFKNPLNLSIDELYPATSIKTITEKIFNEIGYTISSAFKDSDFFDRLYLPFTKEYPKAETNTDGLFNAYITSDTTVTGTFASVVLFGSETYDYTNSYDVSAKVYTSNVNKKLNFISKLVFKHDLNPSLAGNQYIQVVMTIQESTNGGTSWANIAQSTGYAYTYLTNYTFSVSTGIIDVFSGYKYRVSLTAYPQQFIESAIPLSADMGLIYSAASSFTDEQSDGLLSGGTYDIALNLPEITCLTFIQALKHLFNLYFYTDVNTRTVYFEPRDDFYTTTTNADWSNKLDLSQDCKIEFIGSEFSKIINYRYKEDGADGYVKNFQDDQALTLSAHEETIDNKFSKEGIQDYSNPVFAPTIMDTAIEIGLISERIPKLWKDVPGANDQPEWNTKYEPRIFYYAGRTVLATGESYEIDGVKQLYYPKFYTCDQTAANSNSLWFNTTNFSYGLFEKYYRNEVKYYNESRIFTAYFHLTSTDISQLDLRNPIRLSINGNESDFYILEITDFNPYSKKPVKVTLLKRLGSEAFTTLTLDATEEALPSERIVTTPEVVGVVYTNTAGEFAQVYHTDIRGGLVETQAELTASSGGSSHD